MTILEKLHQCSKQQNLHNGYVAISTVIIIMLVIVSISLTYTLLSIDRNLTGRALEAELAARSLADSCAELVMLEINTTETVPTSLSLDEGTCSSTLDSQVGNNWTVTITATAEQITQTLRVSLTRDSTITVNSWEYLD